MSNDTQHYTNLEIFRSLLPKLKAAVPNVNWDSIDNNYTHYQNLIDTIATVYRSGYGRGQKGRSFLIGEKKKEIKTEDGAKVCWIGNDHDTYYPNVIGTIGTISCVDCNDDLWVNWPVGSCEVHKQGKEYAKTAWCCAKNQCLLIDTNVKGNIKKGDRIIYLGTDNGFYSMSNVWPSKVATGVVDVVRLKGVLVNWDNPDVVGNGFNGRTHVWYEDIAKVIPWD